MNTDATNKAAKTNTEGFVYFANRQRGYRGDRGTWAKIWIDDSGQRKLTVMRARHGIVSEAYETEMNELCNEYGFSFSDVGSGMKKTVNI